MVRKAIKEIQLTVHFNQSCGRLGSLYCAQFAEVSSLVDWHHIEESQSECVGGSIHRAFTEKLRVMFVVVNLTCFISSLPGKMFHVRLLEGHVTCQRHIVSTLSRHLWKYKWLHCFACWMNRERDDSFLASYLFGHISLTLLSLMFDRIILGSPEGLLSNYSYSVTFSVWDLGLL